MPGGKPGGGRGRPRSPSGPAGGRPGGDEPSEPGGGGCGRGRGGPVDTEVVGGVSEVVGDEELVVTKLLVAVDVAVAVGDDGGDDGEFVLLGVGWVMLLLLSEAAEANEAAFRS